MTPERRARLLRLWGVAQSVMAESFMRPGQREFTVPDRLPGDVTYAPPEYPVNSAVTFSWREESLENDPSTKRLAVYAEGELLKWNLT